MPARHIQASKTMTFETFLILSIIAAAVGAYALLTA